MASPKSSTGVDLSGKGYNTIRLIGRGQFASACLVSRAPGEYYVSKQVALDILNEADRRLAEQEVLLLRSLDHRNIVHCFDSFVQHSTLIIIVEYCEMGDLRRHIKYRAQQSLPFAEDELMRWFVQLADAVAYIHGRKILHRDIKSSNVFMKGPNGCQVVLGDFGISRVLEGSLEAAVTVVGTPFSMAPEVCRSEPYGYASDLWSLGCLLYELCTLKHAFASDNLLGLVYRIVSESHEPISDVLYTEQLRILVDKLLSKSPHNRPTASQLLLDDFVRPFIDGTAKQTNIGSAGAYSLRPGGSPTLSVSRIPPPPVHPPPTVSGFLPEGGTTQQLVARLKRKLLSHKIHWVRVFADNDKEGRGGISCDIFENAVLNLEIGFGKSELHILAVALGKNGFIAVDDFRRALDAVPGSLLLAGDPKTSLLALAIRDPIAFRKDLMSIEGSTISVEDLRSFLLKQRPSSAEEEIDKIIFSLDKLGNDTIPIQELMKSFMQTSLLSGLAAPPPPSGLSPQHGGGGGGLMPGALLPGPVGSTAGGANRPVVGPRAIGGMAGAGPGSPMSPPMSPVSPTEGFSTAQSATTSGGVTAVRLMKKIDRHISRRGLRQHMAKLLGVFQGDRDWLVKTMSSISLGLSRQETKFLKEYLEKTRGPCDPAAFAEDIRKAASISLGSAEENISTLLGVDGSKQLIDELASRQANDDGFVDEADVRKIVMRLVPFLQSSQLEATVLTPTVKNYQGQLDIVDLALRTGGVASIPQRKPFAGLLNMQSQQPSGVVSDDTFVALSGRVLMRLEELGISEVGASCLVSLADVFARSVDDVVSAETVTRVLETAPLGLSHAEAETLTMRCTNGLGVARLFDFDAQVKMVLPGTSAGLSTQSKLTKTLTAQLEWIRSQLRRIPGAIEFDEEMPVSAFMSSLKRNGIEEDGKCKAIVMFCDKRSDGTLLPKCFLNRFRRNQNMILNSLLGNKK